MTLLFVFILNVLGAHADDKGPNFEVFQSLMKAGQLDEAFRILSSDVEKEKDPNLKSLSYFGLGIISQKQKKDDKAVEYFNQALLPSKDFEDLIRIYKGRSLKALGQMPEAKAEFLAAQNVEPKVGRVVIEAQMEQAELELADKKWIQAYNLLAKLEKRARSDIKYPEILMGLVRTELARQKKHLACKWARKLYSKYPHHPVTQDWTIDLQKAQVDSKPLECVAALADQKTRIRNLQLQGLSDRAQKEIEELKSRATALTMVHVDTLLATYYLNEGKVTEALNVLLPYYKKESRDFNFFMLLARVAARAGEFQIAVGSFQRAHALNTKSKAGRSALFQAAFLSYQFQDYDGAGRRYEEFIQKYPKSGLSQDAKWHLAWIRYLKGDYSGAYDGFKSISSGRGKKKRTLSTEKNMYWMAMSLHKMGRDTEAIPLFEQIASDKSFGFYSLSAKARLPELKANNARGIAKQAEVKKAEDKKETGLVADATQIATLSEATGELKDSEENESEDNESTLATFASGEEEASEGEEAAAEEPAVPFAFQSGNMAKRFQRANDLITLGFNDWAIWELYELEKRTSQQQHLKTLISRYESIGAFNRSSYISQIFFSKQRHSMGLKGDGKNFWQAAYPRAYDRSVTTFARAFDVPEEFAWSIMRAESQFKPDVKSPVGALGLMQLMPYTAMQVAKLLDFKGFNVPLLFDSGTNIRLGTRYLQRLLKQFEGNIPLSAAAYNAGPHKVRSWLKSFGTGLDIDEFVEHIPYLETRNYVKKVVQNYYVYRQLYNKSAKPDEMLTWLAKPVGITIVGDVEAREIWE